eukprot:3561692-Rhodomonas_salina.1
MANAPDDAGRGRLPATAREACMSCWAEILWPSAVLNISIAIPICVRVRVMSARAGTDHVVSTMTALLYAECLRRGEGATERSKRVAGWERGLRVGGNGAGERAGA